MTVLLSFLFDLDTAASAADWDDGCCCSEDLLLLLCGDDGNGDGKDEVKDLESFFRWFYLTLTSGKDNEFDEVFAPFCSKIRDRSFESMIMITCGLITI